MEGKIKTSRICPECKSPVYYIGETKQEVWVICISCNKDFRMPKLKGGYDGGK